jgi:hypothetical protein
MLNDWLTSMEKMLQVV